MATRKVEYHTLQVARESFFLDTRYTNLKPIGDGSYGFVCAADDTLTGRRVAIKKVGDTFCDLVDAKRILREIKLLRHFIGHENVIQIYDLLTVPPDTVDFRDVYIVTNLMESDMDRILGSNQPLTDQHFQYFLYQVLRGLKYLHSANVLHRDLKPSNLLVNANCDLTICDFGLARGVEGEFEEELTEYVVTRWYRAPELLCDSCYYGKTVDLWSVGCIFAEMLGRKPFFQGSNPLHQLETIISKLGIPPKEQLSFVTHPAARKAILARADQRPRPLSSFFPPGTNPKALDLLQKMLTFHPEHRITVEGALAHPYLEELHSQMDEPVCSKPFDFSWEKAHIRGAPIPKPELQRLMYEEMLFFRGVDAPSSVVAVPRPVVVREGEGMETETEGAAEEQQAQADAVAANNQNGAEAAAAAPAAASPSPAPAPAKEVAVEGTGEMAASGADGQHGHRRGPSKPARTTPPTRPRNGSRNNSEAEMGNEAALGAALGAGVGADPDAMSVVEGEQP